MNLEELKSKVTEAGGNRFESLSERTVDHLLNRELKRSAEDSYYTDDVIKGIVEDLKEMDGNLHFEVGKRNTEYKTKFEEDWKKNHPEPKPNPQPEKTDYQKLMEKFEQLEQRMQKQDEERSLKEVKEKKAAALASVKEGLGKRFKDAGREVNEYILKQTLRDVEIPEKGVDIDAIIKSTEKAYDKNLKEAGLDEGATPRFNIPRGGGAAKAQLDDFFKQKAKKEGWNKK